MEHLPCYKPFEYLVTMTSPEPSQEWSLYVLSLNLISILSPPKLSEAEHLILSLRAKRNHFGDFYFSPWFQLKQRQILYFLSPFLLVEKMPTPRGVPCGEEWPALCFFLNVYLFGCARSSSWHAGSLIFLAACELLLMACGIQLLDQGPSSYLLGLDSQTLDHQETLE